MTSVKFTGTFEDTLTQNVTRYMVLSDSYFLPSATEDETQAIISATATMKNAYVEFGTAPGVGNTVTCTLRVNEADTGIVVVVSGTDTTGSDVTHTASVSPGDRINWKVVTSATNSAARIRMSIQVDGATANESIMLGTSGSGSAGTANYFALDGMSGVGDSQEVRGRQLCPTAGTLKNLYINLVAAPGVGANRVFTVYQNGSSTGITVTIADGNTTGSDTSNTISVSAGDTLSLLSGSSAGVPTASKLRFGITLDATTSGHFPVLAGGPTDPSTSAVRYTPIQTTRSSFDSTGVYETTEVRFACGQEITMKNAYVKVTTAPGAGKSWAVAVRVNGSDSALIVNLADANTSANDTDDVTVANFDNLSVGFTPTGTPTSPVQTAWGINMMMTAQPSAGFEPVTSWFL